MSSAPVWKSFPEATVAFREFLRIAVSKGGPLSDWHVVFQCGTVARVRLYEKHKEFKGYDSSLGKYYVENWPVHRIPDPTDTLVENRAVREYQRELLPDEIGRALRVAYHMLLADDYPHPGAGSDRSVVPMNEPVENGDNLWALFWIQRDRYIFNLALARNDAEANALGADLRRYDHLFPRVVLVIAPDLSEHIVSGPPAYPPNTVATQDDQKDTA